MAMQLVEQQVRLFGQLERLHQEPWKRDHDAAMAILDFEEYASFGIECCERLHRCEEALHLRELKGQMPYSEDLHKRIERAYRWWRDHARLVAATMSAMEERGLTVTVAAKFRAYLKEVENLLTSEDEFFAGEKLERLIEKARQEHHDGLSEPMDEMCK